MPPPLCLPTYFPPIPPPYPPLTSRFILVLLPSFSSGIFLLLLLRVLPPSSFISVHPSFSYFSLSSFSIFSTSVSSSSTFTFFFFFFPFPSHLAPSLNSLLHPLFFTTSDSYYFSFFIILLRSPFTTPFFSHSPRYCLQFIPSFFFRLSSFFSSSYSSSFLHSFPFLHHSLLHVSRNSFIPPYPPLIRSILIFLFFFLFSFHLFLFSCLPFSFVHFSCSFLLIILLFFFFLLLPSFSFTFSIFFPLLPFLPPLYIWSLLLHLFVLTSFSSISHLLFRTNLFRIFLVFSSFFRILLLFAPFSSSSSFSSSTFSIYALFQFLPLLSLSLVPYPVYIS